MEYVLPKELAKKHSISLKTVYNRLSKYSDKIRIKKQYWKMFIHENDFTKLVQERFQNYNPTLKDTLSQLPKTESQKQLWAFENNFEKLQNEFNLVLTKKEELIKQNRNLTEQANNLAIWLNDEKNAKKDLEWKYYQFQEKYNNKIEELQWNYNHSIQSHSQEKLKRTRRYYFLFSLCCICALVLLWIQLPQLLSFLDS